MRVAKTFSFLKWATFLVTGVGFILLTTSCDKVTVRPKEVKSSEKVPLLEDRYLLDSRGGLFKNVSWYEYSLENHIIWPYYDIFVIKTPTSPAPFKLQISSYYQEETQEAGIFTLQVASFPQQSETPDLGLLPPQTITVSAPGCGNPYTNPDYQNCLKDPQRNAFTYLDLETLQSRIMTDEESLQEKNWDIAFKGTLIKLNSGTSGPSRVVGALARRFSFFFDETGRGVLAQLQNKDNQRQAQEAFQTLSPTTEVIYYLPDGIDRVIHESYWYRNHDREEREANPAAWWLVRSADGKSFVKMNVATIIERESLDENKPNKNIETDLQLSFWRQAEDENIFSGEEQNINVLFSTAQKTQSHCFRFATPETYPCVKERSDWDVKLVVVNMLKDKKWIRDWRFFTNNGAIGPLTYEQVNKIKSGRNL